MYTLCLVDGDENSRGLFVDFMRECKRAELVGAYATGQEALREVPKVNPSVVLMDVKLPDMSGIECVGALRQMDPHEPILMLTDHEADDLIFDSFRAGAHGYLLKRYISGKELEAAIVDVMAGGRPMSRSVARKITGFFQEDIQSTPSPLALTAREWEVLDFLTQGLAYKQIAGHLAISQNTVHQHVRNLYDKLQVQTRSDPRLYSLIRQYKNRLPLNGCTRPKWL